MSRRRSWEEAIRAALENQGKPLHYREIWDEIKANDYYESKGSTPENTVNYTINKSIREQGDLSPFLFLGEGVYGLSNYNPTEEAKKDDEMRALVTIDHQENAFTCKEEIPSSVDPELVVSYGVEAILLDGCFLARSELERILRRWQDKKNLILQGPPGTGKTWLAKRLGMALIGHLVQEPQLRSVQFHPNLSYEDFVRGWRPTANGGLALHEGVFMQMVKGALEHPSKTHVLVIEEINRGNPAQIFGELLTLLEAGKRKPRDAMQLCYPDTDGVHRPVHVPENLYVIGTMNIADRSLALVDMAFRRRFAFVDLEPCLGTTWRDWVVGSMELEASAADTIQQRLVQLNSTITADSRLGKAFRIGHSYVTPSHSLDGRSSRDWFAEVVATELRPLLHEYWFDAPDVAEREADRLLEGW